MATSGASQAPRLLAEMVVIVFSVLLALGANEWRQTQARNALVATVLETVHAEATANRAEVARALDHHRGLLRQLQSGGIERMRLNLRESRLDTTTNASLARTLEAVARAHGADVRTRFRVDRVGPGEWRVRHGDDESLLSIRGDTAVIRGPGGIALRPPFLLESAWETAQATQATVHMDPELVAWLVRIRQYHRRVETTSASLVGILYGTAAGDIISALQDLASYEWELLEAYDRLLAMLAAGRPAALPS